MLKIKTGQAPNLPWWRLQKMSDEEIEKFNDGFMMIERLCEDEGCPNSAIKYECVGTEESVFEKEIWNRAIEEAAKVCDINSAENVRKLKK